MRPPPGDLEARLRILRGEEPTWFHPYPSLEEFNLRRSSFLASLNPEIRKRIAAWLSIGRTNPSIPPAYDPPFTELSFEICADVRHLADRILQGNGCLGQALALDDMCFINQIDGGDEWPHHQGRDRVRVDHHAEI